MLYEGRRSVDLAIGIGDDHVCFTGGLRRYPEWHANQALIVHLANFDEIEIAAFHEILECRFMRAFDTVGKANAVMLNGRGLPSERLYPSPALTSVSVYSP